MPSGRDERQLYFQNNRGGSVGLELARRLSDNSQLKKIMHLKIKTG